MPPKFKRSYKNWKRIMKGTFLPGASMQTPADRRRTKAKLYYWNMLKRRRIAHALTRRLPPYIQDLILGYL